MHTPILSTLINNPALTYSFLSIITAILLYAIFIHKRNTKLQQKLALANESLDEANYIIKNRNTGDLEEELSLVRATMESRKDGIIVLNQSNKIIDYNKAALNLLKISEDIIKTANMENVVTAISSEISNAVALKNIYDESLRRKKEEHHVELKFNSGAIVEFYAYPHQMKGRYVGKILQFRDLTKIKTNETKLLNQVNLDSLTKIPTRALLIEMLTQSIWNARRNRLFLAVILLDIDKFKNINERIGHVQADKLLLAVTERLQSHVTIGNTVARLSADKFAVIYTSGKNENDATFFTKACLEKMNEAYNIEGHRINAPLSIGVAIYPKDGDDPDTLLKNADIAMRRVKNNGGNASQFFTDALNKKYKERLMIENHLRNALKLHEFSLLYHPILDVNDKKMVGVEVLLRWPHPILGDISPAVFVPVAEQTGMILPIGYWILRTGCEQIKKWKTMGTDCYLSFNISSKQLEDPSFIDEIKKILSETGLSAEHIAIEITESIIMDNVEEKIFMLNSLKKIGITLIIDDFGTGFSCLNILNRVAIDKIKIDNSFMQGIPENMENRKLISCICAVAQQFNFGLIAEGVSSAKQEAFLLELKCNEMQGFHFYKPLTAEALTREIAISLKSPEAQIVPENFSSV